MGQPGSEDHKLLLRWVTKPSGAPCGPRLPYHSALAIRYYGLPLSCELLRSALVFLWVPWHPVLVAKGEEQVANPQQPWLETPGPAALHHVELSSGSCVERHLMAVCRRRVTEGPCWDVIHSYETQQGLHQNQPSGGVHRNSPQILRDRRFSNAVKISSHSFGGLK